MPKYYIDGVINAHVVSCHGRIKQQVLVFSSLQKVLTL